MSKPVDEIDKQTALAEEIYNAAKKFLDAVGNSDGYPRWAVMAVIGELENRKLWLYNHIISEKIDGEETSHAT